MNEALMLPNLISMARLVAAPVLFYLIVNDSPVTAGVLMAGMGWSDFLDGYLARKSGTVTNFGILIDPVSDRLVVVVVLIALLTTGQLPVVLFVLVLAREIVVSGAFMYLSRLGLGKPRVKKAGKTSTAAILASFFFLILGGIPGENTNFMRPIGLFFFGFGALISYVATFRYTQDVIAWRKTKEPT